MEYSNELITDIVNAQREFFKTGVTLSIKWRIKQLKKLKQAVIDNSQMFLDALNKDLGRSNVEGYLCDVGPVIVEINETIKGLKKWARPENHYSGLLCFPSIKTKVYKMPYGVSLIISPFNFPILLTLGVLIASIAGGNTAIIKASSKSINCTNALKEFIGKIFNKEYITLIDGGHDVADMCLSQRVDKIFYTGSPKVAKHVLSYAAENITSTALELGGETGNWCIIRSDADIKDAARKIAFFKMCNAGQICININQIAISKDIAKPFIEELKKTIIDQIGEKPIENEEYPNLIDINSFNKCKNLVDKYKEKVIFGGNSNIDTKKFDPTIIYPVDINDDIVMHELFNPILPIVEYNDEEIDDLLSTIESREHPLAMYLFTKNIKWAKKVMATMQYGGGCINEVCIHMMVKGVPFNGVGHSGMGAYHGKWGFNEFTHPSTVLIGKRKCNLSIREHPYNSKEKKKIAILKKLEK